jgi:micrococcal nuclease
VLRRALAGLLVLTASAAGAGHAVAFSAVVAHVSDGDTLWVRPIDEAGGRRKPVKVRLLGIDAPEICQPWGTSARDALSARVSGRRVEVPVRGRDEHGRSLGTVLLDGENINAWLVAQGHAWGARWHGERGAYAAQEEAARKQRLGLFSLPDPMQPRAFRQFNGPCDAGSW